MRKSLLAIIVAYAIPLAVMWPLGTPSIVTAIIAGTAISGIILAGRTRYDETLAAGVGGFMGAVFGGTCLSVPTMNGQMEGVVSSMKGVVVGAVVGAVLMSMVINESLDDNSGKGVRRTAKAVATIAVLVVVGKVLSEIVEQVASAMLPLIGE